jgi:hypothetical protein
MIGQHASGQVKLGKEQRGKRRKAYLAPNIACIADEEWGMNKVEI